MKIAKEITLKNLLNAYLKNNKNYEYKVIDNVHYLHISFKEAKAVLIASLSYFSIVGRHQFKFPLNILKLGEDIPQPIDFFTSVEMILSALMESNKVLNADSINFIEQIKGSYRNLKLTFSQLDCQQINELFAQRVNFKLTESSLLAGHQMHPTPKSCDGFTSEEFIAYYPELRNQFQMHYFLASKENVMSDSLLSNTTNDLLQKYFLDGKNYGDDILIPIHPWQAQYIKNLAPIKKMLEDKTLTELGPLGQYFNATSSIRSVYSERVPYMLKLSLNVMITNSVRMQYERELSRAISVGKFWKSIIATQLKNKFPSFNAITDPAFICLQYKGQIIEESAVLFRNNPFMDADNNVACLASLCQDNPFKSGNRFNEIIPQLAVNYNVTDKEASILWFNKFLQMCIEPLLWLFTHYEIALEGHQQNLLIKIDRDGMPECGYYRDSQGYYISDNALSKSDNNLGIYHDFATGSTEFIAHHLSYYLICNSVFGVINAIAYAGYINEIELIKSLQKFIFSKDKEWINKVNSYLNTLLNNKTLPIKDNLGTKLFNMDELTAPLEMQSIYSEIPNPLNLN